MRTPKHRGSYDPKMVDGSSLSTRTDTPEHVSIRDLMDGGEFGDVLPPEDEARAYEAFLADRERNPVPCPRV